jgi:hypothetical protein
MRKFISAALAFAMTATAMAGMTVARAAVTDSWSCIIGGGTQDASKNNNTAVVQNGSNNNTKYWSKPNYDALAAFVLGTVNNGDNIDVTVKYQAGSADNPVNVKYYILSNDTYDTLTAALESVDNVGRYNYYKNGSFASVVGEPVASGSLETMVKSQTYDIETEFTAGTSGKLIAYCTVSNNSKITTTSLINTFNVTVTSPEPPAPEAAYFTVDGTVDVAGTYTKVNVTAFNGTSYATATKELATPLDLGVGAGVSIGIKVNDVEGTFNITNITLE